MPNVKGSGKADATISPAQIAELVDHRRHIDHLALEV
jgi:hypothetical protein